MTQREKFELAIIGNKTSIFIYKALGIETYTVNSKEETQEKIEYLIKQHQDEEQKLEKYAVIFIEEIYYKRLPEELIDRLSKRPFPALIPVPSPKSDDEKFGMKRISKIVERAVGSDIA